MAFFFPLYNNKLANTHSNETWCRQTSLCRRWYLCPFSRAIKTSAIKQKKKRPARTIELHLRLSYKPPKMSPIFISLFLSLSACWRLCAALCWAVSSSQAFWRCQRPVLILKTVHYVYDTVTHEHARPRHWSARSYSRSLPATVMKGGTPVKCGPKFPAFSSLKTSQGMLQLLVAPSSLSTPPRESDPSSLTSPNLILSSALPLLQ